MNRIQQVRTASILIISAVLVYTAYVCLIKKDSDGTG
jgi:hypothetical protein